MIKLPRRGFTIIEILVVIAIVAVLSAVATIGYGKVAAQMRDKQREAHVATILSLLENYYKNFNEYPPACSGINYDAATKTCISTGSAPYMYNSGKALNTVSYTHLDVYKRQYFYLVCSTIFRKYNQVFWGTLS